MRVHELEFRVFYESPDGEEILMGVNIGTRKSKITVLDRLTGFGWRDIETGYTDPYGKFCLASGNFDIRRYPDLSIPEAIELIKHYSNTVPWEN